MILIIMYLEPDAARRSAQNAGLVQLLAPENLSRGEEGDEEECEGGSD
jgi:hypothetical protein